MKIDEISKWIKNSKRLDILHTYASDILLVRKVTNGTITTEQYKKQLIANLQSQIDQLQISLNENQDIVNVLKDPKKNIKFKNNVVTCKTTILQLQNEIKDIEKI